MAHESESGLVPWAGTSPYPLEASFFEFCPTVFFDKVSFLSSQVHWLGIRHGLALRLLTVILRVQLAP